MRVTCLDLNGEISLRIRICHVFQDVISEIISFLSDSFNCIWCPQESQNTEEKAITPPLARVGVDDAVSRQGFWSSYSKLFQKLFNINTLQRDCLIIIPPSWPHVIITFGRRVETVSYSLCLLEFLANPPWSQLGCVDDSCHLQLQW